MANPVHTPSAHDIAPSIPAQSPAYFKGPFVFYGREYFIITFTTTPEAIARALPAPLQPVGDNKVLFEFMNMHDAPGLGSYSEAGVVIPALLHGEPVNYTAQMYLDCEPPVYGGREIWGFPKKRGKPVLKAVEDTLVGTLEYEGEQIAFGTMPYKAIPIMARHDRDPAKLAMLTKKLSKPAINLKIIPNADGSDCIRQLVQYQCQVINVLEAWEGPARLHLVPHIDALVADFPVLEYHGATHTIADIILPYGHVVHDYLKPGNDSMVTPGSFGTAASLPDRPPMRIDHTPKTVPSIRVQDGGRLHLLQAPALHAGVQVDAASGPQRVAAAAAAASGEPGALQLHDHARLSGARLVHRVCGRHPCHDARRHQSSLQQPDVRQRCRAGVRRTRNLGPSDEAR